MVAFEPVELPALTPVLLLAGTALALFVIDSVEPRRTHRPLLVATATIGSLLALGVTTWFIVSGVGDPERGGPIEVFGGQLVVDQMALFFIAIVTIVTALVSVASYDYMRDHSYQAEYYSLVLLAATGMATMATANSLATIFIALELASLPSYALVSILKTNRGSVEAGLKYFLIGALSSAIFVYGISLVYGVTGALQLNDVAAGLDGADEFVGVLGIGVLLMIGGFAFKTASVPFHFWAPEAYEGAPAPISAFLSSASKAAGFVIAFRVFTTALPVETLQAIGVDWVLAFQVLAVVTMIVGNFAAAVQEEVKRMLAYSSIGHAGYVLIGLAAITGGGNNDLVLGAAMTHLLVYGFMNTGAFLFVAMAEYWGVGRTFADYNGLRAQAPIACVAMAVFMFSLAGLPPFAGFFSKLVLFVSAIQAGLVWLAAVGVISSALSVYYYSRVVKALWFEEPIQRDLRGRPTGVYAAVVVAAVMTVAILFAFGPVFGVATDAAAVLLP